MAFTTRLTKVGHGSEHFNERTGMCYHQTPPWERVVGHVRDAGQAKPHLEHNPLSLLGACYATSRRQLNDPGSGRSSLHSVTRLRANAYSIGPLLPSETRRRYHPEDGRCGATAATVSGAAASEATTRCERMAPLYL